MKRSFSLLLAMLIVLLTVPGCQPAQAPADTQFGSDTASDSVDGAVDRIDSAQIVISEVMPDNEKLTMGHGLDWVELYYREEATVDLSYYALTDDLSAPEAYPLTGMQISEGEYLAVVLPEDAPFHLSAEGETVYLTCQGSVIAQLTYSASTDGESFDERGVCLYPTPGYANNEEGYLAYLEGLSLPALILTEVLSSGDGDDWVEVKNNSDQPLDLSGYTLTDKRKEPARYAFPAVILQPGEHYVVFCSGNTSLGQNHASFKISSEGETMYLSNHGAFCDVLILPSDLAKNESYGRFGKDLRYFASPTPGAENGEGYENTVSVPAASVPSGLYADPLSVTLSGTGTIYYTLDGSRPTLASAVYTGPIPIDGTVTVRAFCTDGTRTSNITAYTYLIGATHDLPVVTVSLPQASLTGEEAGILNHVEQNFEYEGQLTLIENGEEKFSVPFGFRLHGHGSRNGAKQNFQLRFRSEYGVGKLKYPLFENREFDEFNSLLLKGGSEDWANALLRDELATAVVDGTTALYAQAVKPVVLYLGGEYWGIYYLRERFSDDYVASHFDVSEGSVDIVYSSGGYAQTGSAADYTALKNYVKSHDMATDEAYSYLCERVDVTSLMDWYICRSYFGDRDLANIRRFRTSEGDGKWRWMFFDLDWSFYTNDGPVSWPLNNYGGDHVLINAVLKNPRGRDAFLKRYAQLMSTVLNEQYINGVLDSIASVIQSEIPRDRQRWGRTESSWKSNIETIRNYTKDGARTAKVKADLKTYFSLTDAEMTAYFGG